MPTEKRPTVPEALKKLWELSVVSDRSDDHTRAIVTVVDALYLAARTNPKMLSELEKFARGSQKKHIGWSILVPERSEVIQMMTKIARGELAKKHREQFRAARISAEMLSVAGHHLAYIGIPYAPAPRERAMTLYERTVEEVQKSLDKKEDAEDIVVAFLVAYGVPRRKARGFVQSAVRRRG